MLVRVANREDPDQIALNKYWLTRVGVPQNACHKSNREDLIRLLCQKQSDLGLLCLSRPFSRQLMFLI